jgi:hypothetical protein
MFAGICGTTIPNNCWVGWEKKGDRKREEKMYNASNLYVYSLYIVSSRNIHEDL